jgi:uncharacterized protein
MTSALIRRGSGGLIVRSRAAAARSCVVYSHEAVANPLREGVKGAMLLSFRFTNHRSFRWEQQLNLTPAYKAQPGVPGGGGLAVAGIFGANASGKSNVLHALSFMQSLAVMSDREVEPGLGIARYPFRLDEAASAEPARYVVDIDIDGVLHTYGFTLDDEQILEEWLYHYPLKKRRKVFERESGQFKWGEESSKRDELEQIAGITAPTALFLSTTARFSPRKATTGPPQTDPLHSVYRWFLRLRTHLRGALRPAGRLWPESEDDRLVVVELLRAADLGIVDVRLKPSFQDSLFPADVDSPAALPDSASARRLDRARLLRLRDRQRLQFSHRGPQGDVAFEIADESAGTVQLLALAIDAATVLRTNGVMIVDEIDASLHPMLTAKLIGLFQTTKTNPARSQLIFTSHDPSLLGTFDAEEVLHRDQIWFTEKDQQGLSSLYPLSDFKPRREGENRQRRYLNGNYGGVPDLSADIFEQALAARGELGVPEHE